MGAGVSPRAKCCAQPWFPQLGVIPSMAASLVAAERGGVPCAPSHQRWAGHAGEIPGCSSLGGERFVRSAPAVGRAGWRCPKVAVLRALAVSPQALPAAACPGKPCQWSGASRGCPGDATPPTPFWAFPSLRGSPVTSHFSSCWCAGRGEFSADSAFQPFFPHEAHEPVLPLPAFLVNFTSPTEKLPAGCQAG